MNATLPQTEIQGLRLLVAGPAGRRLLGLRIAVGDGDASTVGGPSAQGAARFALATAATGHAISALALKLLEERGGGGVEARAALGRGRGGGGVASMFRAIGEVCTMCGWCDSVFCGCAIFRVV